MGAAIKQRKRTEISVRFLIRSTQRALECPVMLQVRLTVDGQTSGDYSSGVEVRPGQWDQKGQKVSGRGKLAAELNERLVEVDLKHRDIYRELKRRYAKGECLRPTSELVKREFQRPGSTSARLADWYKTYLNYLDSLDGTEDGKAPKTMERAYKCLRYVRVFCGINPAPDSPDVSPAIADLNTAWGKRFHAWLQTDPETGKPRMVKDSANKYLSHIRDSLNYAIDCDLLAVNVLDKFRPKRGKGRPVYFLEPVHLTRLAELRYEGTEANYLWWCRLMCYTGLDYKDAVRYVNDRASFEEMTLNGPKIVIQRSKPPHNVCEIPMLPEVIELLKQRPTGPANAYPREYVSDFMKDIVGPAVGFPHPFTSKIARKTAGANFLRIGYTMEGVSKFLGHSTSKTTEQSYVRVSSYYVDAEMRRVSEQTVSRGFAPERIVRLPPPIAKTA